MKKQIALMQITFAISLMCSLCKDTTQKYNSSNSLREKNRESKGRPFKVNNELWRPLLETKDIRISEGNYSLIFKVTCFLNDTLETEGLYNDHGAIKEQNVYFLYKSDTLRKIEVPSDMKLVKVKGSDSTVKVKTNVITDVSIIKGKNDFFYYFTGKEDCEFPCKEYWSFYNKTGHLLWQLYNKEEGNYWSIKNFGVSNKIYEKNGILKTRVYPIQDIYLKTLSSVIKPAESR